MFTYHADVDYISSEPQGITLGMDSCVASGYTGRDQESVQTHIDELKIMGALPLCYPSTVLDLSCKIDKCG
ncbi:hypothetical protein [Desulfogranum marinum]|uniref:hypothetical protein n=1 Tax=Desulfogranum marinum TaxID=453220 RepID=UPI0029C93368|nr:hypothetical protein [Desulfogranum marinum]